MTLLEEYLPEEGIIEPFQYRRFQFFALGDSKTDTLVQIQFRYPYFYDSSLIWINEKISSIAVNGMEPSIHRKNAAQSAADIFDDYFLLLDDYPDYEFSWFLIRDIEKIYEDSSIATLLFRESRYLGGAHPIDIRHFINLDKINHKELMLFDIISPDKEPNLTKYAEQIFRAVREIKFTGSLNAAGFWFNNDKFMLSENFSLADEGLVFYYNPYDIAPFSMGSTQLLLPI